MSGFQAAKQLKEIYESYHDILEMVLSTAKACEMYGELGEQELEQLKYIMGVSLDFTVALQEVMTR